MKNASTAEPWHRSWCQSNERQWVLYLPRDAREDPTESFEVLCGERAQGSRGGAENRVGPARDVLALACGFDHLGSTISWMGPGGNESLCFEVVNKHGGVGTVDVERRGEFAHRHRLVGDAPHRSCTSEAQPDSLGDLAP